VATAKMGDDGDITIRLSLKDKARFSAEAKSAASDIDKLNQAAGKSKSKFKEGASGIGSFRKMLSMGADLTIVGRGVGYVAEAVASTGYKLYKAGSDAFETQLKYRQVFKELTPQVDKFISATNMDFGIPTKELQDATALFAIFAKSAGVAGDKLVPFSTQVVQASEDLASFHNVDVAQVFNAMQSGLAGMVRPLRQYGIFLSDAAVKQTAVAMGLVKAGGSALEAKTRLDNLRVAQARYNQAVSKYGEGSIQASSAQVGMQKAQIIVDKAAGNTNVTLNEQQKILARQQFIMNNVGDATGDLARTISSPANQMRMLRNRFLETTRTIGLQLLPGINAFVKVMNSGLKNVLQWLHDHAAEWGTRFTRALELVKKAIGDAVNAFKIGGWQGAAKSLDESAGAGGHLETAIHKVVQAFKDIKKIWDDAIYPLLTTAYDWIVKLGGPLALGLLAATLHFVADHATALKVVLIALAGIWAAETISTLVLNIAYGIHNILLVASIGLEGGLAAAREAATLAAEQEAVAGGFLNSILNSSLVTLLASTVAKAASAVWTGIVTAATWAWTAAQWALNVAMNANPISLLVIAIVILIAGIVLAYKRVGWFRAAVDATFRFFKAVILGTVNWVKRNWQLLIAILLGPVAVAVYLIRRNWDTIKNAFGAVVGWLGDRWSDFVNALKAQVGFVVGIFQGIWEGVKGAFKAMINFLIDSWNTFVDFIPAIHISILGKHIDEDVGKTLHIKRLHEGGTVTKPGIVNMRPSEELVVLPAAASVIPHENAPGPGDMVNLTEILKSRPIHVHVELDRKEIAKAQWSATADSGARR
jgi:hypothetical protein